ncbi:acyltransferase family protein [Methylobacterium sp. ID0610]|uniref:acyltransferase family protein n=1 Tax=Methylobacterium carpenticola TaxID=3344827 RepID=UPI0036ABADB9
MAGTSDRIEGLDGLRAIAAILVFLEHRVPGSALHLGGYGVRLFFVLSGYLIVGGLAREMASAPPGRAGALRVLRGFAVRRMLRILPLSFAVLGGAACLAASGSIGPAAAAELPWHALFLTNVYAGRVIGDWPPLLGHFWSLAVEEQFYLLAAPAIVLVAPGRAAMVCAALILAAALQFLRLAMQGAGPILLITDSLVNFGMIALGGLMATTRPRWEAGARRIGPSTLLIVYLATPLLLAVLRAGLVAEQLSVLLAAALIAAVVAGRTAPGRAAFRHPPWRISGASATDSTSCTTSSRPRASPASRAASSISTPTRLRPGSGSCSP